MIDLEALERSAQRAADDNGDISAPEVDALARDALAAVAEIRLLRELLREMDGIIMKLPMNYVPWDFMHRIRAALSDATMGEG